MTMTAAVNSMSTSATDSQKAAASNINNKVLIRKEADEEEEEAGLRQTDKRLPMGWILDQGPPSPSQDSFDAFSIQYFWEVMGGGRLEIEMNLVVFRGDTM